MVDVVICYAREDAAAAGRLAEAVSRRGYSLWSEDVLAASGADVTDRISAAKAAIVLWSAAGAASEWVRAEANFARGQNKLIQASTDDAPPPLPFRAADMASIAGWRGEETHPGWRRIRSGLETLCGPPPALGAVRSGTRAPAAPPAPAGAAGRGGGRFLLLAITLALLAAVAIGTLVWMQGLAPVSRQGPPTAAADDAVPPAPAPGPPAAAPAAPPPVAAVPATEPAIEEAEAQPVPRPTGPRISRRNSENMRLFCERAGRGTPQCRAFARQLRNQRR